MDFSSFNSLVDLVTYFSDEYKCREWLSWSRWKGDVVCPYCGHHHCHRGRSRYICPECGNKFSVTVGTIFENTKVSLRKWFMAIYLISYHKKGISSCQLSKDIRVTQKTAWYMLMKIRTLFVQKEVQFRGDVEMDEAYMGGKIFFKHLSKKKGKKHAGAVGKVPVFGIIRRGRQTTVRAWVIDPISRVEVIRKVQDTVAKGSRCFTDESKFYDTLSEIGYKHYIINHSLDAFVWGGGLCHTNSIEGFWAHLRKIYATYHSLSKDHLQHYLDEAVFRWNNRKKSGGQVFQNLMKRSLHPVTYSEIRSRSI